MTSILSYFSLSKRAEAIIAKRGISAWLILICAAIMSFLMLYTLSLGNIANNTANSWRDALTDSATVRIHAPEDAMAAEANAVIAVLETTPNIASFEEVTSEAQLTLLEPWLGSDIPTEVLLMPRIFSVQTKGDGVDADAMNTRLEAEAPHAVWDDHLRWRGPLLESAERIKTISWFSTILIGIAFALLIFLAVEASTSANATTILLLRQVGATDLWIRSGFERRFVIRSVIGSALGAGLALIAYWAVIAAQLSTSDLVRDSLGLPWLSALLVIFICALLGYFATRASASRYLLRNT